METETKKICIGGNWGAGCRNRAAPGLERCLLHEKGVRTAAAQDQGWRVKDRNRDLIAAAVAWLDSHDDDALREAIVAYGKAVAALDAAHAFMQALRR